MWQEKTEHKVSRQPINLACVFLPQSKTETGYFYILGSCTIPCVFVCNTGQERKLLTGQKCHKLSCFPLMSKIFFNLLSFWMGQNCLFVCLFFMIFKVSSCSRSENSETYHPTDTSIFSYVKQCTYLRQYMVPIAAYHAQNSKWRHIPKEQVA